jgi:hypothetical protein
MSFPSRGSLILRVSRVYAVLATLAAGCGDDSSNGGDRDARADAATDASRADAGGDGGADGAPDAQNDAPGDDADLDSGMDATHDDGATDASGDASSDADDADAGPDGSMDVCAEASDFVFEDEWAFGAEVRSGATYCTLFSESRELPEERELKAQLTISAGAFRLPDSTTSATFGIPICIEFIDGSAIASQLGSLESRHNTFGDITSHNYTARLPTTDPGYELELTFYLETNEAGTETLVLDGGPSRVFEAPSFGITLCDTDTEECFGVGTRFFVSCHYEGYDLQTHQIDLGTDGDVTLELRIGESPASTEPGAFIASRGTFRGTAFDITDYYRLVYRPDHHHFSRHFAIFFDAPIDGVCGLELRDLSPFDEGTPAAYAIDCDFERLETLTIESATFMREE